MAKTKLRQLLEYVEDSPGGISLQEMARDLDLSISQAENMMGYWVRKGRLQAVSPAPDCAGCASGGSCSLLIDLPSTYQVTPKAKPQIPEKKPPCQ
jgi:hypothetical protein